MIVFFYDNQVLNLFWCQFVPQRKRLNVSTVATELAIGFLKELHMWKTLFNSFNLPCGWHLWYFLLWSYDITKKKWQGKLWYQNIQIFKYSVKKWQNIRIFVRVCFSVSKIYSNIRSDHFFNIRSSLHWLLRCGLVYLSWLFIYVLCNFVPKLWPRTEAGCHH